MSVANAMQFARALGMTHCAREFENHPTPKRRNARKPTWARAGKLQTSERRKKPDPLQTNAGQRR